MIIYGILALAFCGLPAQTLPNQPIYGPPVPSESGPTVHVALSRPTYWIEADPTTGTPQMPTGVAATAEALRWPAGIARPVQYTWRVYLDWDMPAYPTHHQVNFKTFFQPSPLKIDLTHEVRGGQLTVVAKALLNGKEVCGQAHAWVLGKNPTRQAVLKAFPHDRFGLIASKIGMAESSLRQFGADGLPIVSRSNDVGMMQLNAPSGAVTSADEVWDWRANLHRGLLMLTGKRTITILASRHAVSLRRIPDAVAYQLACLNFVRGLLGLSPVNAPSVPPLSTTPGTGLLASDSDPDHLALSQVEREMIRRYNGGSEFCLQIQIDPTSLSIQGACWQIDLTRGGMAATRGDLNYILHVLHARSGLVLAAPTPTPHKPAHKKRTHHHHRSRLSRSRQQVGASVPSIWHDFGRP